LDGKGSFSQVLVNWFWVFVGNLLGSLLYGALFYVAITMAGQVDPGGITDSIRKAAEAKTLGYAKFGFAGAATAFVKAILCNWMVCLGVVMSLTTTSTIAKIAAAWMPIVVFFAQGFEHSVVNMFLIPTGMMLGAKVTIADWWLWNQIPVTLGNIVGGLVFTGLALYVTYRKKLHPAVLPIMEAPETVRP